MDSLENPTFIKKPKWLYWAIYHFSWSDWFWLFENRIAKASPFASAVGYLIYLNDYVSEQFGFDFVTQGISVIGLSGRQKLLMVYFGLVFLAIARLIYLWRRPTSIRFGPTAQEFSNYTMANFTFSDFLSLYQDIEQNGNRTLYGKYYTDDWEAFCEDATWAESGRTKGMDRAQKIKSRENVSFKNARERHEDLLRSISLDRYYQYSASRKISLTFALGVCLFGYGLFLLPNLDLFLSVLLSAL